MNTAHRRASGAKRKYARDPAAIYKLMSRIQLFTPEELTRLQIPIRVSFEALKSGHGTHSDYQDLTDAINCAMIRAESIDPIAETMVLRARDAMLRLLDRFRRTSRWGFDGPAIAEVAEAVDFHEQLLSLSTPQQMIDAMKEVHRRCARGFGASSQAEVTP